MERFLVSGKEDWFRRRDQKPLAASPWLPPRAPPVPSLLLFSTFRQSLASTYLVCTTLSWAMDVDKNSTSYREQERESAWRWTGRGAPPEKGRGFRRGREASQTGEWGGGEGVRVGRGCEAGRSVSGARPHLVQLVLEHFQLRKTQLGDVNRLRHVGKED